MDYSVTPIKIPIEIVFLALRYICNFTVKDKYMLNSWTQQIKICLHLQESEEIKSSTLDQELKKKTNELQQQMAAKTEVEEVTFDFYCIFHDVDVIICISDQKFSCFIKCKSTRISWQKLR